MNSASPTPESRIVPSLQIIGITDIPEINAGDQLGQIIVDRAARQGTSIESGDILVITQKIVSKSEGRTVDLSAVEPSQFAIELAHESDRDARLLELVLRESRAIIRMDVKRGIIITETKHGFVSANAGIDTSNVPGDNFVTLLPLDPDKSAQRIRRQICQHLKESMVAVIVSDTFGRAWREGQVDFALGVAGINPLMDYRGSLDACGKILRATNIAIADELAAASELVTAKAINIPVVIVRGYSYQREPDGVQALIRHPEKDLFR